MSHMEVVIGTEIKVNKVKNGFVPGKTDNG